MRREPHRLICGALLCLLTPLGFGLGCNPPPRSTPMAAQRFKPAPRPVPKSPRMYVVANNDTLSRIARRFGVVGGYHRLARLNNIQPPYSVLPGLMLRVPSRRGYTDRLRGFPLVRTILTPWLPCGTKLGAPRRRRIAGCRTAYCAAGAEAGERLCRCLGAPSGGDHFWYERKGRRHRLRASDPYAFSLPPTFSATRTDLDGDGEDELILATHRSTSNGIGIMWFDVEVYAPGRQTGAQARFDNAGEHEVVMRRHGDRRCALRAMSFEHQPGLWRGGGNFWVQRLYRYHRGRLLPHPKALVRRVRLGGPAVQMCSRSHSATARSCRDVPIQVGLATEWWHQAGHVIKRVAGRVTGIVSGNLVFQPRKGPAQRLPLGYSSDWFGRFGDQPTRRLFPGQYRTAGGLKHWVGRRATRVTYSAGTELEVLWISRSQTVRTTPGAFRDSSRQPGH